jgi:tetrapyrrole methylase family protein / MazG family protein
MITLVGLGPGRRESLTLGAYEALRSAATLYLRTAHHPVVAELQAEGLSFVALDPIYDRAPDFDHLYRELGETVLRAARQGDVTYAVPGHPLLGERSVELLIRAARAEGLPLRVAPASSFIDAALAALAPHEPDAGSGHLNVVDATALGAGRWALGVRIDSPNAPHPTPNAQHLSPALPALFYQVYDRDIASQLKLALLEEYPEVHPVRVIRWAGIPDAEAVLTVPLAELDRPGAGEYDHLTAVYVPPVPAEQRRPSFQDLVDVVARLRGPDGCPWDREQTYVSLKRFVLEESYEVLEAIDSGDPDKLCDELGDLLLQVVLQAELGRADGYFDIRDVIAGLTDKLIRRHPHVFGDVQVTDSADVLVNWEALKRQERPERESVLDGVPTHLPALLKALEVSKRVVKVGFEWPTLEEVLAKLDEEVAELREALPRGNHRELESELGDILFTVVNVARHLKIDAEEALRTMVARFSDRFREVERLAKASGRSLDQMPLPEMEALWQQAKATLKSAEPLSGRVRG